MIRTFSLFAILVTLSGLAMAQTSSATISEALVMQLDPAGPVVEVYTIDCSAMEFASDDAAERFFTSLQDNLVAFSYNAAEKTAEMKLSLQHVADRGWGATEWNNYFNSTAERYNRMFEAFN